MHMIIIQELNFPTCNLRNLMVDNSIMDTQTRTFLKIISILHLNNQVNKIKFLCDITIIKFIA